MRVHLSLFCAAIVLNGCTSTHDRAIENVKPDQPTCISSPDAAAQRGLETLKTLVNGGNYKDFGLKDASQIRDAELGAPAKVLVVPNEKLADYKRGMNIYSLL